MPRRKKVVDEEIKDVVEATIDNSSIVTTEDAPTQESVEVPIADVSVVNDDNTVEPIAEAITDIKDDKVIVDITKSSNYFINKPVWCYPTSVATKAIKVISGIVYLWDDKEVTGRYAVTNQPNGAGKLSALCGWVDKTYLEME